VLRAIVPWEHDTAGWAASKALGVGEERAVTMRIRDAFRNLVPEGFVIHEGDRRGKFRRNAETVAPHVDWQALEREPDGGVQKVAVSLRKRAGGQQIGDAGVSIGFHELRHRRLRRAHLRCGRARRA
jgi:hypothetical protein